jgi:uroporphyrinogen-III synthase
MRYSHIFLTRPQPESEELAQMLAPLGVGAIVQPAFDFEPVDAAREQGKLLSELQAADRAPLLIFTSTRAVSFGLAQLPAETLVRLPVAAIGPSTSDALREAGVRVTVRPSAGFTSEALLETLKTDYRQDMPGNPAAVILAAPGGRKKMEESLAALGWDVQKLYVYRRMDSELSREQLDRLGNAKSLLAIWTSANAMQSLSGRLPPADWFKLCQAEWMVISERLLRLSRAYGPAAIHLASGPSNYALVSSVRALMQQQGHEAN